MIYCALTFLVLTSICESGRNVARATIDVNLAELQYLAAHLDVPECRRLLAALRYKSYDLPKHFSEAELGEDEASCLEELLHWNSAAGEGRGLSHEHVQHRLRQIGRHDLADWLGRTTFKQLGNDLFRSLDESFPELPGETTTGLPDAEITTVAVKIIHNKEEEKFWMRIGLMTMGLFATSLFTLVLLVGLIIIHKIARCRTREELLSEENCEESCELLSAE